MKLDPRIIEGKRVLTPFDIEKAKQFNGCCGYRIRKLTPLECFRLMGFSDEDFDKIKGISNTQLYKMAGNSIVVDVVEGIFNNLLRC